MLTIYTNHPGGNLVHKHQTIKFDVKRERSATNKISWTDKKCRKIASPQIKAHGKKTRKLKEIVKYLQISPGNWEFYLPELHHQVQEPWRSLLSIPVKQTTGLPLFLRDCYKRFRYSKLTKKQKNKHLIAKSYTSRECTRTMRVAW